MEKMIRAELPMSLEVLLAKNYEPDKHNIEGWFASEKLDGVRAYWTGTEFRTRNDKPIYAPDWYTKNLPPVALDGELFIGRGQFQKTVSVVRKHDGGDEWKQVQYLIFDLPAHIGDFTQRMQSLTKLKLPPHAKVVEQVRIFTHEDVMLMAKRLWGRGAEGIMLRDPQSKYERKRSSTLLKVKDIKDDIAEVIGQEAGKGKHKGRLGALVCVFQGKAFNVGTGFSDAERSRPPAVGSRIRFAYTELTDAGIPRFPRYLCIHTGD